MTTTLITGANRGIGLELARIAHDKGHTVIATARDPGRASELRAISPDIRIEPLDVADESSIAALADRLADTPVDILINNAGIFEHGCDSILDLDVPALRKQIDVNTLGPILVTRALLGNVTRSDRKLIVNTSSNLGSITDSSKSTDHFLGYRVSKAALNMTTATIAQELKDKGITVVALHPGWVQTDMGGNQAPLEPTESATDIWNTLDTLSQSDTGAFISHDNTRLPW
jgi:NAD(P)-dependent dehydrogenase (short-subunit alcohol dehydrogenase family)